MKTVIYKNEALSAYDGSTSKLAAALGITRQAVSQWSEDAPIPELSAMKLRYELRRRHFAKLLLARAEIASRLTALQQQVSVR